MQHTDIDLDHPIAIEILSLRDALAQQQHATQKAAAQVQKYAFEALSANNKARQLASENSTLQAELDVLRTPQPVASPSPAEAELTLALRRANSRLDEIQSQLLEANASVAHAHAERERTLDEVSEAYRLLEAARSQEAELRASLAGRDAEKRSYELALGEYAALVRDLEKGAAPLNLKEPAGGSGTEQIRELTAELARARAGIESLQAQLDVERRVSEAERVQLAEARTELGKKEADDKSAAALVERYMKFSQYHTDVLQRALTDQSTRHATTLASLSQRTEHLEHNLATESARYKQLQSAVDALLEDLARESAGRRREIRVRLAITGRTARIEEDMRRWERRIREHARPQNASDETAGLLIEPQDLDRFRTIVDLLGAPLVFRDAASLSSDDDSLPGPLAHILSAEIAVESLTAELERETARRIELERERAQLPAVPVLEKPPVRQSEQKQVSQDSVVQSSASTSIASLQSTSGLNLTESTTSLSWNESTLIGSTVEIETSPKMTEPLQPLVGPITIALPTEQLSTLAIPFPTRLPSPPQAQTPTEPQVLTEPQVPGGPHAPTGPQAPSEPLSPPEPQAPPEPQVPPEPQASTEAQSLDNNSEVQKLLDRLPVALQRYGPFQNAFRDCHLALSALKTELRQRPRTHLLTAVERLDDYNEDARVEVEIRIADEARKANGFETMLHLSPLNVAEVVEELRAFVDGSLSDIRKALETAQRKRDELEHDIAAIKLSMHAPDSENEEREVANPPPSPMWARKSFFGPNHLSGTAGASTPALGVNFPLLRRVASGTLRHSRASSLGGNEATEQTTKDPFASLGLKIPMPAQHQFSGPNSALPSPIKPNYQVGSPLVLERTRTTSMYHLGLGRSGLDLSTRSMSVTPTSKLGEESDDGVE